VRTAAVDTVLTLTRSNWRSANVRPTRLLVAPDEDRSSLISNDPHRDMSGYSSKRGDSYRQFDDGAAGLTTSRRPEAGR
jgi:hypothetical protein